MKNLQLKSYLFVLFISVLTFGCSDDDGVNGQANGGGTNRGWLIPEGEVRDGGPGKDGIPSVDSPSFDLVAATNYLDDEDLVIAVKEGNEIKGYSHAVLDWHEIINDEVGGRPLSITYCPLTGTAIGWDRTIDGVETTFGVSGLLYNSNLIPYDRRTDSNWSQIRLDCVEGQLQTKAVETFNVLETTWGNFKRLFPDAQMITLGTGFSRDYERYPYGNYKTSDNLIFAVTPDDQRLHRKERVRGVIDNGSAKVYRFENFVNKELDAFSDTFQGRDLVIAGSENNNYIVVFDRSIDDVTLEFSTVENGGSVILEDNEGTKWDVWGKAVEGPRAGQELKAVESFMGYWFSWGAFYPGTEIRQ